MAVWLIAITFIVFLSFFTYLDVWYFTRFVLLYIMTRLKSKGQNKGPITREELLKEYVTKGVVLPSDLDLNLHMNNSKYLRELDFSRVGLYFEKGLRRVLLSHGAVCLVNAINVRYRRSLQLLQKFQVRTKIIGWEEKAMYLEQRMTTDDGFVAAIALVKMAIRGTSTPELMKSLCGHQVTSPLPSAELKAWQDSINLSSKHLREESGSQSSSTTSLSPSAVKSNSSSSSKSSVHGLNRNSSTKKTS